MTTARLNEPEDVVETIADIFGVDRACELSAPMMHGPRPYRWCKTHNRLMLACEVPPCNIHAPFIAVDCAHCAAWISRGGVRAIEAIANSTVEIRTDAEIEQRMIELWSED